MSEPPQHDRAPEETIGGGADPTRDIRLPSLPGRPPPVLPHGWVSAQPPAASPEAVAAAPAPEGKSQPTAGFLADEPTDQLAPPAGRPRERTIAFASPEMAGGRPTPTVGPRSSRRWPWVVLALLPVLVIVVTGVWWYLLLRGA